MARKRQIILFRPEGAGGGGEVGVTDVIGTLRDVIRQFSRYNISPDGSGPEGYGDSPGMALFYGPGLTMEAPSSTDEVKQVIVTLIDEDFAWAVLGRMCKTEGLKMMDPETGRSFGG
ncbi:MAG: hypothetical protein H7Y88_05805 [Phycisphaerales bacterium]|nr:hypothetical protein [Phycisphaerales bacterium]